MEADAEGTRERIVRAARELFYDQGYASTSLKQVATRAEVHGGSLYHFFPSKTGLVEAVLESYLRLLDPVLMAPARAAVSDPVGRVMHLLGGYRAHLLASDFSGGCPIGNLALEIGEHQSAARALIRENLQKWRDAVAEILGSEGPRWDVDAGSLAALVLTTMEGAVMTARMYRSIEPFDRSVGELGTYLRARLDGASGWRSADVPCA